MVRGCLCAGSSTLPDSRLAGRALRSVCEGGLAGNAIRPDMNVRAMDRFLPIALRTMSRQILIRSFNVWQACTRRESEICLPRRVGGNSKSLLCHVYLNVRCILLIVMNLVCLSLIRRRWSSHNRLHVRLWIAVVEREPTALNLNH